MRKNDFKLIALALLVRLCLPGPTRQALACRQRRPRIRPCLLSFVVHNFRHSATPKAPVDAYLIADQSSEIALARSAAPASISKDADVMVLSKSGYTTAAKGSNGFLCFVEVGGGGPPGGRILARRASRRGGHGPRPPTILSSGIQKSAPPIALIKRPQKPLCRSF